MKKALVYCLIFIVAWFTAAYLFAQEKRGAKGEVTMEWLSHSHFRFISPKGKVVLTNPWVTSRDSKSKLDDITKADIIVVADGHRDEIGEAPEIAIKTGAKLVAVRELALGYLAKVGKVPENQLVGAGIGDRYNFDGITVRVVHSIHGSGVPDASQPYGGPAAGFIITFENGLTVYFTGSTAIHSDMALYGRLYKPDIAIIILSSNRDPRDAAEMVRLLRTDNPNLKTVIPHHHAVKPREGSTTPQAWEAEVKKLKLPVKVLNPDLGKVYSFTK